MKFTIAKVVNLLKINLPDIFNNHSQIELLLNEKKETFTIFELEGTEAFEFALCTGAAYLIQKYGYFLVRAIKLFSHRNYQLTSSRFRIDYKTKELLSIKNSPIDFITKNPELILKSKKIILLGFIGVSNLEDNVYESLINKGLNPEDYLLFKIDLNSTECLEGLFEYIVCKYFNKIGYFTENQVPWGYHGRPDIAAYKHPIFNILSEFIVPSFIQNLCLLKIIKKIESQRFPKIYYSDYEVLIGEVKTLQHSTQIEKYLGNHQLYPKNIDWKFADYGYEIVPDKKSPNKDYIGLINFSSDTLNIFKPQKNPFQNLIEKEGDYKWFENYIKGLLLYNFTLDELKSKFDKNKITKDIFIEILKHNSINDILSLL